jgi:hypothetical protein
VAAVALEVLQVTQELATEVYLDKLDQLLELVVILMAVQEAQTAVVVERHTFCFHLC